MNDRSMLLSCAYPRKVPIQGAARCLDGRLVGLCLGLLLLVASAGLLYLAQASAAAQLRQRLVELDRERSGLCEQMALSRQQTATADSLARLDERIGALGLIDAPAGRPYAVCYLPADPPAAGPTPATPTAWPAAEQPALVERLAAFLAARSQPNP